jgi:hypothetical protein
MKKFIYIGAVLMMVVSFTGIARAENGAFGVRAEGNVGAEVRMGEKGGWFKDIREIRMDNREKIGDMRDDRKELFDERKEDLRDGREGIKNASDEDRPALIEAQKVMRADFKGEISLKTKEIIEARVKFAANLYNMTVARLEQIADRIDSRIEKLVAEGKDMSDAKEFVAEARVHIENAQTVAAEVRVYADAEGDKEGFFEANKEKIAKIRSELKLAHQSLLKAVQSIKVSIGVKADAKVEVNQ